MNNTDFLNDIDGLVKEINKDFGSGSIMNFGDDKPIISIPRESTGSIVLDDAMGGGWAVGRIHEIMGPESCGKTMISTLGMIEYQRTHPDKVVAIIDVEQAFDIEYAKQMGLDVNRFLISQPSYGELAIDITEKLVMSGKCGFIVVDSVANLVPKKELDGEMEDSNVGLHARLMAKAMRRLTAKVKDNNCVLIFINQYREKIGVLYGSPRTTTGGNALKFYASIRIEISKGESIVDKAGLPIGHKIKAKMVKNKTASPYRIGETALYYGKGFDKPREIIIACEARGILTRKGSWYWYGETRIGNGMDNTIDILGDNPELCEELIKKIGD